MKSLVGYTGFVGSNIESQTNFDCLYNSKNIKESYGTKPDLLIYSGIVAEKFIANKYPDKDLSIVQEAINNIQKINPKKLILISTIDVYTNPINVYEDTKIETIGLCPYGYNRYLVEKWIEENLVDYLIIRLPGLYGKNIKKNFIFDLINVIPSMLKEEKFIELHRKNSFLDQYYLKQNNGFYKCRELYSIERRYLKEFFNDIRFTAISFTDSRSIFQFYNLNFLWKHIEIAIEHNIKKLNFATEPVIAKEVYRYIYNREFINEISIDSKYPIYDFKTGYADIFNGKNWYIFDKQSVLEDIKRFISSYV